MAQNEEYKTKAFQAGGGAGRGKPRTGRKHFNQAGGGGRGAATLKTWSPETEAGAGSQPESCGNVRKMLTAVRAMRGPGVAAGQQGAGPGPRWDRGRRPWRGQLQPAGARVAAASWTGGPAGRASGRARGAESAQSVTWRLGEGSLADAGTGEESLVSFHLKRVG